jgi:hypothetical protein
VDTYYPHDYESSIHQLSAACLLSIYSFAVSTLLWLLCKFNGEVRRLLLFINFGYINQIKQTELLNPMPVANYSLTITRLGLQLFTVLTHHEDEFLHNNFGSKLKKNSCCISIE